MYLCVCVASWLLYCTLANTQEKSQTGKQFSGGRAIFSASLIFFLYAEEKVGVALQAMQVS